MYDLIIYIKKVCFKLKALFYILILVYFIELNFFSILITCYIKFHLKNFSLKTINS